MKIIKAFRREDYGLFIDLVDKTSSVCVDTETGDILFNEGDGDDRYHGAAISAKSFREFKISDESEKKPKLILYFLNKSHIIGYVNDVETAKEWVLEASRIINEKIKR